MCGFSDLHSNTIYDAEPNRFLLGVWRLDIIECLILLPAYYPLSFYNNWFQAAFTFKNTHNTVI